MRVKIVKRIIYIVLVINVITSLVPCRASVNLHRPEFMTIIEDELRFAADSTSSFTNADNTEEFKSLVFFSPSLLDFEQRALGMPSVRKVHVHNQDARHSLHLLSISGSSSHFHCSFFEDKLVAPLGNTSFEICFLPKQLGAVDTTLYIHSSRGSFKFKVLGIGVSNPYRIRPYLGARVPVNSSFSPLISIHNPHGDILQVEEIFSSDGDLHLELPSNEKQASKEFWAINPFETKSIIRANYLGRVENNHTAYIRIRTNRDNSNEMLVVPVEVEVTSVPGLFSPTELLDFGLLRSFDPPSTLPLNLINSGNSNIEITGVYADPPNDAIHIDYTPVQLSPDIHCPTFVAHISFHASKALTEDYMQGRLAIKTRSSQKLFYIPFVAQVMFGTLKYNNSQTMFFSNGSSCKPITEDLVVRNLFKENIIVYNVSIPDHVSHLFTVTDFSHPVLLPSNETTSLFNLTFHPPLEALLLTIKLILHTNLSTFHIPLRIYHGFLRLSQHQPAANKNHLDFGTMAFGQKKALNITVYNENPVSIVILKFLANMEKTAIKLVNMEENNKTLLFQFIPERYKDALVLLKPNNSAMFSIEVTAPDSESTYAAGVIMETQFQHLYIPMHLRVTSGSISFLNDFITLSPCFPGKIASMELKVTSTFGSAVRIRDIIFHPNDTRFYYVPLKIKQSISSHKLTHIGHLFFDMKRDCRESCYATLPTHTPAGLEWLQDFALDNDVATSDVHLATQYRSRWKRINETSNIINVTLQLDTSYARGFLYRAEAHLQWVNIVKKHQITFPLTQIGNTTFVEILLENPADVPIVAQIVPIHHYPSARHLLANLEPQYLVDPIYENLFLNDSGDAAKVFTLLELTSIKLPPGLASAKKAVETALAVRPSKKTLALLLQPRTKHLLRASFKPDDAMPRSMAYIIRNNLTIVEVIMLNGQGGINDLRLSSRKPGSPRPLLFEMTDKHLKNCEGKSHLKNVQPNFTVKRTFTLRNMGQLPILIKGFSIGGSTCEGYGFKVLDCAPIDLQPNTTFKVDIVFTPDFTMSQVQQTLLLDTNLDQVVNYTLQVVIPGNMLVQCATVLPRPSWEPLLYYTLVVMMGFLIAAVVTAGYFEADRVLIQDMHLRRLELSHMVYDKSKIFDLKAIGSDGIAVFAKPMRHGDNNDHTLPSTNISPTLINRTHIYPPNSKNIQKLSKLQRQHSNESLEGYLDVVVPNFFQPALTHLASFVDVRRLWHWLVGRLYALVQALAKIQVQSALSDKQRQNAAEAQCADEVPSKPQDILRDKSSAKKSGEKNRKDKCASVPNVNSPQLATLIQRCNSIEETVKSESDKAYNNAPVASKQQKSRKPKVNELRRAIQLAQLPKNKSPVEMYINEADKCDDNVSTSTDSSMNDSDLKLLDAMQSQPMFSDWVKGKKGKVRLALNKGRGNKGDKQDSPEKPLKVVALKKGDGKVNNVLTAEKPNKVIETSQNTSNKLKTSVNFLEEFVPSANKKKKSKPSGILQPSNKVIRSSPSNISTPPICTEFNVIQSLSNISASSSSNSSHRNNETFANVDCGQGQLFLDATGQSTSVAAVTDANCITAQLQTIKNNAVQLRNSQGRPVAAVGATIRRAWPEAIASRAHIEPVAQCHPEPALYDASMIEELLSQMSQKNKMFNSRQTNVYNEPPNQTMQAAQSHYGYNYDGGLYNWGEMEGGGVESMDQTLIQRLLSERHSRLLEHRRKEFDTSDDWTAYNSTCDYSDLGAYWGVGARRQEADSWSKPYDTYNLFAQGGSLQGNAFAPNINPHIWPGGGSEREKIDERNVLDPFNTLQKGIWMPTVDQGGGEADWSLFTHPDQMKKM